MADSSIETHLQMVELYTLDLEGDADEQVWMINRLRDDLQLKHAINEAGSR